MPNLVWTVFDPITSLNNVIHDHFQEFSRMIYQSVENERDRERLALVAPYTSQFPLQTDHLYFTVQYKSHYHGIRSHYSPVERVAAWMHKFLKFFPVPRKARSSREISRSDRTANVDFPSLTKPLVDLFDVHLVLFDENMVCIKYLFFGWLYILI